MPAALAALALAHTPPSPTGIWSAWTFEPGVLLGVGVAGLAYALGVRRIWRRAGNGRGIAEWRVAAFLGGLATILLALVTPLDALGEALFSAHMVQHLLLILLAAPLLVVADPQRVMLNALPRGGRRRVVRSLRRHRRLVASAAFVARPPVVWSVNLIVLWFWHLPAAYGWALEHDAVHALEHASFLLVGMLWWRVLFRPAGPRVDRGMGILFVFTTGAQMSALGAILTFAGTPWYAGHAPFTAAWGLTPLADQQLAGLVMWLPAGLLYQAIAGVMLLQWLDRSRRAMGRLSALGPVAPPTR